MLNHDFIIGKGIRGLDLELPEERQLLTWYKRHPLKKKKTERQLESLDKARKRGSSVRVIV